MGDLNAKVGHGMQQDIVGKFGLGDHNEAGERFLSNKSIINY